MSIIKDIRSGALPAREIPDFIAWAIRRSAWLFILIAVLGTLILLWR